MATFTVRPEGIIRQPALTMPGNATGAEAACTSLTASQIRTLLSLGTTSDVTFDIVRATTSVQTPLVNNASAALTLGNATYGVTVPGAMGVGGDVTISKSGNAYLAISQTGVGSPSLRLNGATENAVISNYFGSGDVHVYATNASLLASASMLSVKTTGRVGINTNSPSGIFHVAGTNATNVYIDSAGIANKLLNSAGTFTVQNQSGSNLLSIAESTGAATFSGDISMSKTSAQGYIYAYNTGSTGYIRMSNAGATSTISAAYAGVSNLQLNPDSGLTYCFTGGTNSTFSVYNSAGSKTTSLTHDGTNGILSTSSGNMNLIPTGGTVAVTGAVTASGVVSHGAYTVATLPAAGSNAGKMAQVTDSNVAASGNYGATVAAGGANRVKVFSDGTNWVIA